MDVLKATDLHTSRPIVNAILLELDLSTGVDAAVATMIGVLSKNDDDRAVLRVDDSRGIHKFKSVELVVVNAGDIDKALVGEGDSSVAAEYASIGSSIHQRTTLAAFDVASVDMISCARRVGTSCDGRHHRCGLVRCPVGYFRSSCICGLQAEWSNYSCLALEKSESAAGLAC